MHVSKSHGLSVGVNIKLMIGLRVLNETHHQVEANNICYPPNKRGRMSKPSRFTHTISLLVGEQKTYQIPLKASH